jgi:hypothetical protein
MSGIDLLNIAPHQVSRDLRGYSVFFYGEPKSGKTTIATKFPRHLLLAFEKGYNAIPGAMAQPINAWAEFRKVLRQLQDAAVKEKFETIIVDTADIAYDLCEKYICANAKRSDGGFGVDAIGDIPFGKGYTMVAKEFDECLRSIVQMGYGLVLISHAVDKTFTDETGKEFNQIVPTLGSKPRNIVSRMCDIIGYSRGIQNEDGTTTTTTKLFMRGTPRYIAGSRFKYTPDYIDFTYNDLVKAISDAIDKQMEEDGTEYFTDERTNLYTDTTQTLDFDELVETFNNIVNALIENTDKEKFQSYWQPRIVQITEKYLGKGQKVNQCSREQTEALDLIVTDLKELTQTKE